jgi:hypothetical protein
MVAFGLVYLRVIAQRELIFRQRAARALDDIAFDAAPEPIRVDD